MLSSVMGPGGTGMEEKWDDNEITGLVAAVILHPEGLTAKVSGIVPTALH